MRIVVVTLGVLLSLVAVLLAVVAGGLFLDGNVGAGGLAVFFLLVTLLCALLLFRTVPRAALPARSRPRTRQQSDSGFYYGDPTPAHGADRSWGGDGGADTGYAGDGHGGGHGHSSGGSGSDSGSSSGGSDGGSSGGSD